MITINKNKHNIQLLADLTKIHVALSGDYSLLHRVSVMLHNEFIEANNNNLSDVLLKEITDDSASSYRLEKDEILGCVFTTLHTGRKCTVSHKRNVAKAYKYWPSSQCISMEIDSQTKTVWRIKITQEKST